MTMNVPDHLSYTSDHEWVAMGTTTAKVGITTFAADALGDIVFVELPEVGTALTAGLGCGELESTKSVSDILAPADGLVASVNDEVVARPDLINTDAFGAGWLFTMEIQGDPDLLDAIAYAELVDGL
jgi:glycine cleavage system H protein